MICSGEFEIVSEDSSEFGGKSGGKLWSPVGDQGIVEAKMQECVFEKEFGDSVKDTSLLTNKYSILPAS